MRRENFCERSLSRIKQGLCRGDKDEENISFIRRVVAVRVRRSIRCVRAGDRLLRFLNYLKEKHGDQKPHITQYILLYLDGPSREELQKTPLDEIRVSYFSYDKSLNEQK